VDLKQLWFSVNADGFLGGSIPVSATVKVDPTIVSAGIKFQLNSFLVEGKMWARDKVPRGTIWTFTLPTSREVEVDRQSDVVFVVDDDYRVREALLDLFASQGLDCFAFASAAEYLRSADPSGPSCLVLDVLLPDINGLDLQSSIVRTCHPPIVFISGHGDITSSVRAMKAGAVDFLTKPWHDEELLRAVRHGLEQDRQQRRARAELMELESRLATLTPREREVLPLVTRGLHNKQAAVQLGISEVTLQIHRSKIMQKMKAASLADLVRMAAKLKVE
jgi:FixJ family two-component response regulator